MTSFHHQRRPGGLAVCRVLWDLAALAAAWRLTVEVRLLLNPWLRMEITRAEMERAAPPLGVVLAVWLIAALGLRIYRHDSAAGAWSAAVTAGVIAVLVTFFSREFGVASLSRSFVVLFVPVSLTLLAPAERAAWAMASRIERAWGTRERVAMLGQGAEVRRLVDSLNGDGDAFTLAGMILADGAAGRGLGNPLPLLGTTGQLAEVINRERLDRIVIVGDSPLARHQLAECARVSRQMGVAMSRTLVAPEPDTRLEVAELTGLQMIEWRPLPRWDWQELAKRALDVTLAATLLAVLGPLLLLVAAGIRLTSRGPVFYRSPRAGKGGRYFTFLKFRSMYVGQEDHASLRERNEQSGHLFKIRRDPRVTPLGHLLRRFSLDELPQLINVVRGEMSLVGPRPLPAQDLDPDGQSRRFHTWSTERSRVLPGITGLWQIRGRSEVPFEQMMEFDLEYVRRWSLGLDLKILLSTPLAVLNGRGAY